MQQREIAVVFPDHEDPQLMEHSCETTFGRDVTIRPTQLRLKSDEQLAFFIRTVTDIPLIESIISKIPSDKHAKKDSIDGPYPTKFRSKRAPDGKKLSSLELPSGNLYDFMKAVKFLLIQSGF